MILVVVGSEPIVSGSRVIGTHHDSPHIDLKARPIYASNGFTLFKTIYYGGIKKYQWANRPLALIGRIDTVDGKRVDVSIGLKEGDPGLRDPRQRAPLRQGACTTRKYQDVFAGEELDPVAGSDPGPGLLGHGRRSSPRSPRPTAIREEDFVSAELQLVPASNPADVGIDRGLVGAYGQDDRLSSYCAARAVMDVKGTPKHTAMAYLSNFEEVGSVNNTGASVAVPELDVRAPGRRPARQGVHGPRPAPGAARFRGHLRRHERRHQPGLPSDERALRRGAPGLRRRRSSATAPASTPTPSSSRRSAALLDKNGIAWQTQTPKVDGYSGGTIGGFLSTEEMEVIDMGVPLLSMHAPFEMSSKVDVWSFYRFMAVFLAS